MFCTDTLRKAQFDPYFLCCRFPSGSDWLSGSESKTTSLVCCAPVSCSLALCLSGGGRQYKATLMWMCLRENTVATHELDSCIVLKDCRCWLSDLSQSILEFPRPHWIMEIINPSGPVEEEKESWGQCFFYLDDLLIHSQVLMFCLLFCCCWWMGKC